MIETHKIIKQDHHWTSEEKIKWLGYGEWVEEADVTEFEYLGYEAAIVRVLKKEPFAKEEAYFGGHLCGYVKIPRSHPYFRVKEKAIDMNCHGGVTFDEAHEEHWIGFDCGHSGDYVPSMENMRRTRPEYKELRELFPLPEGFENFSLFNPVYRNVEYCIDECKEIIDQLINISVTSTIKNAAAAIQDDHEQEPR